MAEDFGDDDQESANEPLCVPGKNLPPEGVPDYFQIFGCSVTRIARSRNAEGGDARFGRRGLKMDFRRGFVEASQSAAGMIPGGHNDRVRDFLGP